MSAHPKFASIEQYIAAAHVDVRPILEEIRRIAHAAVPEATETISYQMPAFKRRKVFFYFAAFKNHIGIFPPVAGDDELKTALLPYRGEKGNLRFPLDKPMPFELIGRVVSALSAEHGE